MSEDQYDPQMRYTEPETKVMYMNTPFKDMAWSDEHKNIFKAWADAKNDMQVTVFKDDKNYYGRGYATLDASLIVGIPVFAKHGISIIQMPTDDIFYQSDDPLLRRMDARFNILWILKKRVIKVRDPR